MADNKAPLHIDLVKNSNQKSDYFGHYYGRVVRVATLSTRLNACLRTAHRRTRQHLHPGHRDGRAAQAHRLSHRAAGRGQGREARRHRNLLPHGEEREGGRNHHRQR